MKLKTLNLSVFLFFPGITKQVKKIYKEFNFFLLSPKNLEKSFTGYKSYFCENYSHHVYTKLHVSTGNPTLKELNAI